MELWKYNHKNVKITTIDDEIFQGTTCDYTSAQDNTPEIESICIGDIEFYKNEIKFIEVID